jgi:hypothetical protein
MLPASFAFAALVFAAAAVFGAAFFAVFGALVSATGADSSDFAALASAAGFVSGLSP